MPKTKSYCGLEHHIQGLLCPMEASHSKRWHIGEPLGASLTTV
jgi:hypothetical protein